MPTNTDSAFIRVWDVWVRLFHWSLAIAVTFLLVSGKTGFQFYEWHRHAGELVLALLVFRILWGVLGSANASLLSLATPPKSAVSHLISLAAGKIKQERGHNAAGGWAVLILLTLLSFQAVSGLFIADEDELVEGAFYGLFSSGVTEELLHLHHMNAQLLMIVVLVHVLMVFVYLLRAGHNLIYPMITGKMQWSNANTPPMVKFSSFWLGLALFVLCIGIAGWRLKWFV